MTINYFHDSQFYASINHHTDIVLLGQTFYSCRALSIRDDKHLREKGLEQFTGSTDTATSVVVMGVDCIGVLVIEPVSVVTQFTI